MPSAKPGGHKLTAKGKWLTALLSVIKDQPATSRSEMLLRDSTNQHVFQLTKKCQFMGDTSCRLIRFYLAYAAIPDCHSMQHAAVILSEAREERISLNS
jgi:hypothetical protein